MAAMIKEKYPVGTRPMRRDAHPKHHGLVRASVEVIHGIPAQLKHGVFSKSRSYEAWIRFSNSNPNVLHDAVPDVHGMAIKLIGVEGSKILDGEANATTQDFVLSDKPFFFARNPAEFELAGAAFAQGKARRYFFGSRESAPHLLVLRRVAKSMSRIANPLARRYWSQTPYRLGPHEVKLSAVPTATITWRPPFGRSPDYLRLRMVKRLAEASATFDLRIQTRTDRDAMPIDDASVTWPESASPFITVARVTIPAQVFDTPDQHAYGEHLSFNPWHSLPEHEPLGGINQTRRVVYDTISQLRHEHNGVRRVEPTTLQVPAGGTP